MSFGVSVAPSPSRLEQDECRLLPGSEEAATLPASAGASRNRACAGALSSRGGRPEVAEKFLQEIDPREALQPLEIEGGADASFQE